MTHQSLIGGLVALAVFGAGCVDRVPLDGTPCPCAPGWVCDKSGGEPGVCVKTATADSGTDHSGGGDSGTGVLSTAIRFVAEGNRNLGRSNAIVGDLDGDGLDDIAMLDGESHGGSVYLYYGRKQFSAVNSVANADAIITGATNVVGGLGDLDGDGLADYAFASDKGVHLFYGSTKRLAGEIQSTAAGVWITAPAMPTKGGYYNEVVGAGDVNGDGLDDLLVETLSPTEPPYTAYLVYGSKTRLPSAYSLVNASVVFAGTGQEDTLGGGAGSAGDTDGDGFSDLVLALGSDGESTGLFYGRASWQSPVTPGGADAVLGLQGSEAPTMGSPGDLDGDGFADLVLPRCLGCWVPWSVPSSSVLLFYGGKQRLSGTIGPAAADCTLLAESDPSFGLTLVAGDLNGDGKLDLVVGDQTHEHNGALQAGALYVLLGGPGRLPGKIQLGPDRAVAYGGKGVGFYLGSGVASGGDVNGDGFDDVLVGAPGDPARGTVGTVYLLLGGPQFPPTMP